MPAQDRLHDHERCAPKAIAAARRAFQPARNGESESACQRKTWRVQAEGRAAKLRARSATRKFLRVAQALLRDRGDGRARPDALGGVFSSRYRLPTRPRPMHFL